MDQIDCLGAYSKWSLFWFFSIDVWLKDSDHTVLEYSNVSLTYAVGSSPFIIVSIAVKHFSFKRARNNVLEQCY